MIYEKDMVLCIGVVGCGSILLVYMCNVVLFRNVRIIVCVDINLVVVKVCVEQFGFWVCLVEDLIVVQDIDFILNFIIFVVYYDIFMQVLLVGKYVFIEKLFGVIGVEGCSFVIMVKGKGFVLGFVFDMFLGVVGCFVWCMIFLGVIGNLVMGMVFMMGCGMEYWYFDFGFYYQFGVGLVMDMGFYYFFMMVNFMGFVCCVQVVVMSGQQECLIIVEGFKKNMIFKVGIFMSVLLFLEFENGVIVIFGVLWDVFCYFNYLIELYGMEGFLCFFDFDNFGGVIGFLRQGVFWEEIDIVGDLFGVVNWLIDKLDCVNYCMVGFVDFVCFIVEG